MTKDVVDFLTVTSRQIPQEGAYFITHDHPFRREWTAVSQTIIIG